ncbi:hypothetical protein ACFDR9_003296 [Janthinobacterium sp. CG_23.3]
MVDDGTGRDAGAAPAASASLNTLTSCTRLFACCSSASDAADAFSTILAFCWVAPSMWWMALLMWSIPSLCSRLATVISPIIEVTRLTLVTISPMVLPAWSTRRAPNVTCSTEWSIRVLISLAAPAERCARLRTSEATTAKPRPCSPARAASTAAFSARMLVWKAMPSMTPMMSTIFLADSLIEPIVATTCDTTAPPWPATSAADSASKLAWRAFSPLRRTVSVSSTIDAAVSSSEPACASVRPDSSRLPAAIRPQAPSMVSVALRTSRTMSNRLASISLRAPINWPISLSESTAMAPFRRPAATPRAMPTARPSGSVMPRISSTPINTLSAAPTRIAAPISQAVAPMVPRTASASTLARCASTSVNSSSAGSEMR